MPRRPPEHELFSVLLLNECPAADKRESQCSTAIERDPEEVDRQYSRGPDHTRLFRSIHLGRLGLARENDKRQEW